jgi:hypothetical protein
MIEAMAGVLVAIVAVALAKKLKGERWMYSASLLALPSISCAFAWWAGERSVGANELRVGIPFFMAGLLFTFVRPRCSVGIVGVLWLLHALYDLTHPLFFINPGAPDWYPMFCASVDFVIGIYLLCGYIRAARANLRVT